MDHADVRRRRSTLKSKMKWSLENSLLEEGNQATKQQYQCIRPRTSHFSPASHFSSSHKENTSFQTNSVEGLHTSRSRPSKSFSGFGHAVDELFLPQRSASKFHKVPLSSNSPGAQIEKEGLHGELRRTISHDSGNKLPIRSKTSRWLRRCVSVTFRHHRRPTPCPQSYEESPFDFDCLASPMPGAGIKPPKIPENLASGAAARAAAAIQNEVLESVRNLRLADLKILTDSESGIGIEVQDQEDDSTETIPRIGRSSTSVQTVEPSSQLPSDPVEKLPEELMVLILSYLDAGSLINAELVSCRWNYSASSHHVWKYVFRNEFHRAYSTATKQNNQFLVGGSGLGRTIPNQDWKRMWRARKALHQRWQDGYAAAIYLDGHTDSVYCVQFDEYDTLSFVVSLVLILR